MTLSLITAGPPLTIPPPDPGDGGSLVTRLPLTMLRVIVSVPPLLMPPPDPPPPWAIPLAKLKLTSLLSTVILVLAPELQRPPPATPLKLAVTRQSFTVNAARSLNTP